MFVIFLIVLLPLAIAQGNIVGGDIGEQLGAAGSEIERRLTTPPTQRDIIGEDIILNVEEYQPKVIRSGLLEDQGVLIFATLSGQPTNPTITIPRIDRVRVIGMNVITDPPGIPVKIGRVDWDKNPRQELSYSNMGYLKIPVYRIPREHDVPQSITIELDTQVMFDVSATIGATPTKLILSEQSDTEWYETRDDSRYSTVYIQAEDISENVSTFSIYDNNLDPIRKNVRVRVGGTVKGIRKSRHYIPGQIFDKFDLHLAKIKPLGRYVDLTAERDGVLYRARVSEGETVYPGSGIRIEEIESDGDEVTVIFTGPNNQKVQGQFIKKEEAKEEPIPAQDLSIAYEDYNQSLTSLTGDDALQKAAEEYARIIESYAGETLMTGGDAKVVAQQKLAALFSRIKGGQGSIIKLNEADGKPVIIILKGSGGSIDEEKREAHIIVTPNVEKAFSTARINLHLPIEKRLFDLPLFSESIDEEIEKTENLMIKLDNVLIKVEKIHNAWKKLCFAVFGFIWTKQLLSGIFGASDARAKQEASDIFRDKFGAQCRSMKLTQDQCVFQFQDKYEEILETTTTAIEYADGDDYTGILNNIDINDDNKEELRELAIKQQLIETSQDKQEFYESFFRFKNNQIAKDEYAEAAEKAQTSGQPIDIDKVNDAIEEKLNEEYNSAKQVDPSSANIINQISGVVKAQQLSMDHDPIATFYDGGRSEGLVHRISVDSNYYAEVEYTDRGTVKDIFVRKRAIPNTEMSNTDAPHGPIKVAVDYAKTHPDGTGPELSAIMKAQNCISILNRAKGKSGFVRACGADPYKVAADLPSEIGTACTDIYSPADCKLLFNACDPVLCPASRCNFGGKWKVRNNDVVQTGIIGSSILCLSNFGVPGTDIGKPGGVVMPICITGIYAGLQNLRSILGQYDDCLKRSKVDGRAVGICDKIRSVYICDVLWREAVAIFNLKGGLFNAIISKIHDLTGGGGEYTDFQNSMDQSVEGLKFFTQQYAQNTFAQFSGGSLPEVGGEICKSAIFGKVPGVGSFLDRAIRPESPPQFTATLDSVLVSDIPGKPIGDYQVFYHAYAGANEPITISVILKQEELPGEKILPPFIVVPNIRLLPGQSISNTPDFQAPYGYNQICFSYRSITYGQREECGFGKVSSGFAVQYIANEYAKYEAEKKNIMTVDECRPSSRLTGSGSIPQDIARLGVGSFSSGLLQTGITRICSEIHPGLGGGEKEWVEVGECWEKRDDDPEDRGRNYGSCWLYIPTAKKVVTDFALDPTKEIGQLTQELASYAAVQEPEKYLDDERAKDLLNTIKGMPTTTTAQLLEIINKYRDIIDRGSFLNPAIIMQTRLNLAQAYEQFANL